MMEIAKMVCKGIVCLADGVGSMMDGLSEARGEVKPVKTVDICETGRENSEVNERVLISKQVLDDFRRNVGRYRAETGGMLGSKSDKNIIDLCHFDVHSRNTPGSFYYDVESMSAVFREWKTKGYETDGIYHSHPRGSILPSYHDISTALLHIRFFEREDFYLPIIQSERHGLFTLFMYVVRIKGENLEVTLEYVIQATAEGYEYPKFRAWQRYYSIQELDSYRNGIDHRERYGKSKQEDEEVVVKPIYAGSNIREGATKEESTDRHPIRAKENTQMAIERKTSDSEVPISEYFAKVKGLFPEKVLDKPIVCIGTGGARSALGNFARCGFRKFILMDKDDVSPSNIATQGVFVSEMGRKKVEVIRDEILDINPGATVKCIDRFLDDTMSDEEFKSYLDEFPGKAPTDYLILGCTDNFDAQKRSSILALKYGIPYLAAMMYKAGAGAELIFVYPGVTPSCPRCLLGSRFEKYENGFENNVDSSACTIFATERMNALKGYIALMLLMYHEDPNSPFSTMLDDVKDRNFVQIRLNPHIKETLGISLFDSKLAGAARYTYMDETLWVPQKPDHPSNGYEKCKLCGGTGHLEELRMKWPDTRNISFQEGETHMTEVNTSEPVDNPSGSEVDGIVQEVISA